MVNATEHVGPVAGADTGPGPAFDPGERPQPGDHVSLYTITQAAHWLRIGESTLYRLLQADPEVRRLSTRIGGTRRFTADQICRIIAYGAVVAAAEVPAGIPTQAPRGSAHRGRRGRGRAGGEA